MNKQKMATHTRFFPFLLVFWLALLGCTPIRLAAGSAAGQSQTGATTPGLAVVDSITINQGTSQSVQVVVQGNLPDGCTTLGEADVARTGEQFAVTLPTSRPADAFCTQALVPFAETIPLDVTGLPAGDYVVNVNGVSESFTLASDKRAVTPQPTSSAPITGTIATTVPTTSTAIVTGSAQSSGVLTDSVNYRNLSINLDGSFTSTAQLTFPAEGEGPWPTVILFAGSGPYDLDATTYGSTSNGQPVPVTNFRSLASELGQAGIAVLRFNKRGVLDFGHYDNAQVQQANVNQLITDADSVLATAIAQPEVNPEQIFLYGWSEGAVVAANLAANHPELAGLILQAPPNGGLAESLNYQQLEVALPYLRAEVDQNGDGQLSHEELATIPNGPVWYTSRFYIWAPTASPANPAFQEGLDANGDGLINIDEELLPVMEARIPAIAEAYAAVAPSATVADTVAALAMPILVLHGRQDGWVSFHNAETIAAAAPETVTIIIYPNLGHALSPSRTPATDAFGPIAARPIANVVDWIERSLE
ncbi:MAG: alpha/beta fold hydrolase [Caldilinea sp. CFX5]|nr:alpha/beta fold hydrolase [Caldilinea sp. CFX5]